MRRSRTSFACLFIVVASILWLSHSTIKEAYDNAKTNWEKQKGDDGLFNIMSDSFISNSNPPAEAPITESLNLNFPPQTPPTPNSDTSISTTESNSAFDNIKYPFQDDLTLPLPTLDLKSLAKKWPHNYNPATPVGSRYAYATFMNTHNPSIRDPYFMAVQSLIYRVLWRPSSKTHNYPFIAFVASHVTQEQRQILAGAGAIVRELEYLDWNPSTKDLVLADGDGEKKPIYSRWRDTFSKLHMWAQTDFDRILFLDADAFPLENIDEMFDLVQMKACSAARQELSDIFPDGSKSCNGEEFIFSGVPQNPGIPVEINVGAMVFTPSQLIYKRFLQNYRKYNMYNTNMADQAFFAWQFKQDGAFPVTPLERKWGGFFPHEEDKGKLKVVHEKLWASEGWLLDEWIMGWRDMLEWFDGNGFVGERNADEFFKPKLGKQGGMGR